MNRIFIIVFMVCNFGSCKVNNKDSVVVLTDFTKELISLYINDFDNIDANDRNNEIIIISVKDTLYYNLSILSNNSKSYKYCREDFVGTVSYLGHPVKVYGSDIPLFYSIKETLNPRKKCKDNLTEYDQICFHKDLSFCKMRTYKIKVDEDISAIQNLVRKLDLSSP